MYVALNKVNITGRQSDMLILAQVKAKAMRKPVDKMITLAKEGSLHARRQVSLLASAVHSLS